MKQLNWLFHGAGALSISCALITPALADQCSYISKEQATKAIARLNLDNKVYFFCEPCGEDMPKLVQIENLSMGTVDYEDYWQIEINGKGIDLAYVFIDSEIENNFANLAMLADCPAQRVSPILPLGEAVEPEVERDYHEGS